MITLILVVGLTYAWLQLTLNGTKVNTLIGGHLSLVLDDTMGEGINVQSSVPVADSTGLATTPLYFHLN